jgi:hypothetical protein
LRGVVVAILSEKGYKKKKKKKVRANGELQEQKRQI